MREAKPGAGVTKGRHLRSGFRTPPAHAPFDTPETARYSGKASPLTDDLIIVTRGNRHRKCRPFPQLALHANRPAQQLREFLRNQANENGGKDNITVIAANISPSPFRLIYLSLRSLKRKHGFLLAWFIVSTIFGAAGFMFGYLYRDAGNLLSFL